MRIVSTNVLNDTITALGMMVCFYYAITAYACVWCFRRTARGIRRILSRLFFPLLGGIALTVVFIQTLIESLDPDFGSGSALAGVGLVFVIGVSILALGVVIMLWQRVRAPHFFRHGIERRPSAFAFGLSDSSEPDVTRAQS